MISPGLLAAFVVSVIPGVGEVFVDDSTGEVFVTYEFKLPAARGRFQPRLFLEHRSGTKSGDCAGPFVLSVAYIEQLADGVFEYVHGKDRKRLVVSPRDGAGH